MKNKIIIVTHKPIADSYLKVLGTMFEKLPNYLSAVNIPSKTQSEELITQLQRELDRLPVNTDVLILADIFGATPCNIVTQLNTKCPVQIVTGLNLPMVIRAINYHDLPIAELAEKAYAGGIEGIIQCGPEKPS